MKSLRNIIISKLYQSESPMERLIIEELVLWNIPFETQYKVSPFRLDVAFPEEKIGLEIDGQEWHTDKLKDKLRDEYLTDVKGWIMERVPGWFAYRYPCATVLKAAQHLKGIENNPRYQFGKSEAVKFLIKSTNSSLNIN